MLEKKEEGLAEARAAIYKAARTRNYTSDIETFIPRGNIYRNAYAFHQFVISTSHLRFAIKIYSLSSHQFGIPI